MDTSLLAEARSAAERLLASYAKGAKRAPGCDQALWQTATSELGLLAAGLDEADGGLGLGIAGSAMAMELAGQYLANIPLFAQLAAITLIAGAGDAHQRAAILPALIDGSTKAAPAICADAADPTLPPCQITRSGAGFVLSGRAAHVPHAASSDLLVVAAAVPGGQARQLCVLPRTRAGITIATGADFDPLRPVAGIHLHNVAVDQQEALAIPDAGLAATTLPALYVLLAAEQTGLCAGVLAMTRDYVQTRSQFGRNIGSFQAVKHALADMMLQAEAARSALMLAISAISENAGDATEAAHVALSTCADAAMFCTGEAIQLHGGIGFTWDYPAHLYFKRARSSALLLGSPDWHRDAIARTLFHDESNAA